MLVAAFLSLMFVTLASITFAVREVRPSKAVISRLRVIKSDRMLTAAGPVGSIVLSHPVTDSLVNLEEWMQRFSLGKKLLRLLAQSGTRSTVKSTVLASAGLAALCALAGAFLTGSMLFTVLAFAGGLALPTALLCYRRKQHLKNFEAALPAAIDLMARSLRAGHSIASAIEIIAEQSPDPLSKHFAQVSQQQQLGAMFRDTMLALAGRVPSPDLHFLITAILVQRESGGDLTEVLDRTTNVISERVRIAGAIRIYSAQGRLTGWILSSLPLLLLVMLNVIDPGYTRLLFTDPLGKRMLVVAAASVLLGIAVIRRIVDIEV